ncbi:chorismate-binding protein [Nesterenkonia pannonica]|uniref:chorismate-binding protein n=1 Tax=Nesterenkonia pannonica TaxID=1548602 RepID=UPI0021645496|nr:chorismate-binding protein [Nesterenkonia pannonica]
MPASSGRRSLLAFGTETAAPSAEELPAWLESVWPGGADWFGMIEYELTGYFFRAERSVIVDHSTGGLEIRGEPGWHELVEAAVADLVVEEPQSITPVLTDLCVRDSRAEYLSKVAAAKEEIRRGNSYEVCLTTAVCGTLHGDAMSAYRRLRSANRAPFTQLLILPEADGGTVEVLSTSPERFLSVAPDGTMRSEPIKGTRPGAPP